MSQDLALLARTPSGDGAFVQDPSGRVWLLGPSESHLSSVSTMERAIRDLDFIEDGSIYPSWDALDLALRKIMAHWLEDQSLPGIESYSVDTLNEILDDAEEFGGNTAQLANTLLRDCPAARDDAVFARIRALLPPPPAPVRPLRQARNHAAQARVEMKVAA